jgi:hypothetical protein
MGTVSVVELPKDSPGGKIVTVVEPLFDWDPVVAVPMSDGKLVDRELLGRGAMGEEGFAEEAIMDVDEVFGGLATVGFVWEPPAGGGKASGWSKTMVNHRRHERRKVGMITYLLHFPPERD